jgi:hypothetical protein
MRTHERTHGAEPRRGENDILVFDLLQGGPQSSHYLYEFTKEKATDWKGQRRRLRNLYDFGYLDRPVGELNDPLVIADHLVYSLGNKGIEALEKACRHNQFASLPAANWHNFMDAAIDANLRLQIKKAGYRYISEEEILAAAPVETRTDKVPLAIPVNISHTFIYKGKSFTVHSKKPAMPDRLFGIDYGNGCRFFGRETDRSTEQIDARDLERNTIVKKLLAHKNFTITQAAMKRFGVPNFFTVLYTTRATRARSIIEKSNELWPNGSHNLLVMALPDCDTPTFRTLPLMPQVLTGAYQRAGKADFYIDKP